MLFYKIDSKNYSLIIFQIPHSTHSHTSQKVSETQGFVNYSVNLRS